MSGKVFSIHTRQRHPEEKKPKRAPRQTTEGKRWQWLVESIQDGTIKLKIAGATLDPAELSGLEDYIDSIQEEREKEKQRERMRQRRKNDDSK
jgi:hypothetical protein